MKSQFRSGLVKSVWGMVFMALASSAYAETSDEYSQTRGGQLYDKWFKVNGAGMPKEPNPSYPAEGQYAGKKGADWRCKECHGWDYRGVEGAYSSGKHKTGIKGVYTMIGQSPDKVKAILRDKTHAYTDTMLSDQDVNDLANFVTKGQIDMTQYVGDDKKVKGDSAKGKKYYETVCSTCHGMDGKAEDMPILGELANANPWETIHKIRYGQPNSDMPALIAFDAQVSADIAAYVQELPVK